MSDISTCKRCLYSSDHALNIIFDEEGICSGCRIHEEKDSLDWPSRYETLKKLVNKYKSKNNNYDCVVPVTGSQDSYYILHHVKKLGLNPLVVNYNKYFNSPLGIRNLANLRIKFDCDILFQNVNPNTVKKITRQTLIDFGSIYWPILAGHSVFPVQTAVRFKIPLIIWGAHQGLEQVGMFSHTHEVEMTRRYRKDHDLMGLEADDLVKASNLINEEDIWQYRYPDNHDQKAQHEKMIEKYDYMTTKFSRTFDTYDYVDCYNYMNLHDLLKLYKYGYSKVTDHASREIRFNRLSRSEGLILVKKYEQVEPDFLNLFESWLDIDKNSLQFIIDQHRNEKYWNYDIMNDKWQFNSLKQKNNNMDEIKDNNFKKSFIENSNYSMNEEHKYITFGKGYP